MLFNPEFNARTYIHFDRLRLENSFLKERVRTLQQQVEHLNDKIAAVQRQHLILVMKKERKSKYESSCFRCFFSHSSFA